MAEQEPDRQRDRSDLDRIAPTALIRLVVGDDGGAQLSDANRLATALLGSPFAELRGRSFAAGFFGDDAAIVDATVRDALAAGTEGAPGPIAVVRWGAAPPVRFVGLRAQRDRDATDASVLVALTDLTDQYRLDTILCGGGSGVFVSSAGREVTWMSPVSETVLGIPPETFVGLDVATLVHPEDQPSLLRAIEEMQSHPGLEVVHSVRLRHPLVDGTWWRVRLASAWLPDDPAIGGVATRLQLTVEPTDDPHAADRTVTLAELTPSGLLMTAGGRVTFRNNLARQMLGPAADLDDEDAWVESLRPTHRQSVRDVLQAAREGRRSSTTAALDRPGGVTLWMRIEGAPAHDAQGDVVGSVVTLLDVTTETETREQLQRAQAELWQLANHDQLTGLANRMQFSQRLDRALARLRRDQRPVAVLYCDLDRFKPVNDRLGHLTGDGVLIAVANRLSAATRQTDTVCRFGGDEFLIICEGFADPNAIVALAERLVASVAEPIVIDRQLIGVGISIGMVLADAVSTEADLLARSDAALYRAKQSGRGRVVVAD